jgi:site-specific recombinase XerC
MVVAAYVEKLLRDGLSKPTVKQHLAAIRMLFDWMVAGGVLEMNPASFVRGPKYVIKKGKTPVLTPEEARLLLDSIDVSELHGLRDRALLAMMVYSFARMSAVVGMNVDDYYQQGKRWWVRLHEKGGEHHEVPAHHKTEEYLDAYLQAGGLADQKGHAAMAQHDQRARPRHCEIETAGRFSHYQATLPASRARRRRQLPYLSCDRGYSLSA